MCTATPPHRTARHQQPFKSNEERFIFTSGTIIVIGSGKMIQFIVISCHFIQFICFRLSWAVGYLHKYDKCWLIGLSAYWFGVAGDSEAREDFMQWNKACSLSQYPVEWGYGIKRYTNQCRKGYLQPEAIKSHSVLNTLPKAPHIL